MASAEGVWSVGEAKVQGHPVVYKFTNERPAASIRHDKHWLTVISWRYDGSKHNGIPPKQANEAMIALEDRLEESKRFTFLLNRPQATT